MKQFRLLTLLVLLAAVVTGARAAWTGGTYTATATENLGAITVNGDATLTINEGVTVTVTGGINVASGTLTIVGPGTLVVNGNDGSNGQSDDVGGNGTPGGVAISGNIVVQDGATVQANGGAGGNGGAGIPENGGHGANGAAAISGNVTVQGGATVTATGGNGGNGGNSPAETGGNGGNGGNAFAGTLTYKSGTVTANGGNGGSGGSGMGGNGSSGSAGNAFANDVDFTQTTGYSVTDGSNTITTISNQKTVVISGGTPIPPTVAVTGVTLNQNEAQMTVGGETLTLTATVNPEGATDKSVTWSTSDANVATVDNGVVTAVAAGTATITVTTTDGSFTATCAVTVAAPEPAEPKHLITATHGEQTRSLEQPLPYATTIGEFYEAVTGESFSSLISTMSLLDMPLTGISSTKTDVVSIGELNGASTPVTVNADGKATVGLNFSGYVRGSYVSVVPPLYAYVKDGVKDADKWTVKVGEGQAQALPIGGLSEGDAVTLQYNGRLKVKGVKATSDAAPAAPATVDLDASTKAWADGSAFAVPAGGLTYSDAITVSGDVTLTLTEGTTLTLNKGISLAAGATLTVEGNGTMVVNGTSGSTASTVAGSGTLVLMSGTLTATGGNGGSVGQFTDDSHGGNGGDAINGSVIVSGGSLTARGGNGGSVGDYCENCSGGNGGDAISGTLTINGGSTSVNDGSNGSIGNLCGDCTAGTGGKAVTGNVTDNRN